MKHLRKLLAACFLLGSVFASGHSWAADANQPAMGEQSAKEVATAALAKDALCTKCHDETEAAPILSLYQTKHGVRGDARTPTCQSCHGDSANHLKGAAAGEKTRPAPDHVFKKGVYQASEDKERATQCLACHKGGMRNNWDGAAHQNNGVACNDCHVVHRPKDNVLDKKTQTQVCFACHKEQRADSKKISHHPIQEGKVVCSDCHNPHGSTGPKLMKKNTVTETCYQCHAEKRGPFLFEHQPVVEDCANCHNAHGSNVTPLLKSRAPFLCQECHDGTHASATIAGPNAAGFQGGLAATNANSVTQYPSKNLVGRACMNCHSQIHGSNSPAGGYFQR
jgi:DmsE family decaheme c-type cytochrome